METLELKNTITKIKKKKQPRGGLRSRIEETEENISELEARTIEITQSEKQRENSLEKKIEQSHKSLWDYNKRFNICVIRILEVGEKESKAEKMLKEIMAESFLYLAKDIDLPTYSGN